MCVEVIVCYIIVVFLRHGVHLAISRLCYDASPSVRLSVTEVHWRTAAVLLAVLLAGGSSRAMLASARLSCKLHSLPMDGQTDRQRERRRNSTGKNRPFTLHSDAAKKLKPGLIASYDLRACFGRKRDILIVLWVYTGH